MAMNVTQDGPNSPATNGAQQDDFMASLDYSNVGETLQWNANTHFTKVLQGGDADLGLATRPSLQQIQLLPIANA